MIKKFTTILAWIFIFFGLLLSLLVIYTLYVEDKLKFGIIDWAYASKLNNIASVLAFLFTGAGTFAIFITLSKQQEQFEQAQRQVVTQQFETTFFNMLNQLFNIKNVVQGKVGGDNYTGQMFFHQVIEELREKYKNHLNTKADIVDILTRIEKFDISSKSQIDMVKDDLNNIYLESYNSYYTQLSHYYRYFYNLVRFVIENREIAPHNDALKYIQLIQAQLSNDELGLIFCNSLSDKALNSNKENKIFLWIEKYKILENLDQSSLLHRSLHMLYPNTLFKFLNRDEKKSKSSNI